MKINALHCLYGAAALAFIAGIGLTAVTMRQASSLSQSLRSRVTVVKELQAMTQTKDRYEAAVRACEALSNTAPVSLSSLLDTSVTNVLPEIRELESKPLDRGWTLTRSEVVFNEINLDQIPAVVQVAESQRPPWRLAECSLSASTKADGCGRVVLILEALGKPAKIMEDGLSRE